MSIHTCVWGPRACSHRKKNDKNGASSCILSVPKYVIINLKIDNKSTTQILCLFFSKINPNAHVSTKINTFTFYEGLWGATAPGSQRNVSKNGVFSFLHQILHTRRVDSPVIMWTQIRARGSGASPTEKNFGKNGAIWRNLSVPIYVIINLKINNFKDNFPQ